MTSSRNKALASILVAVAVGTSACVAPDASTESAPPTSGNVSEVTETTEAEASTTTSSSEAGAELEGDIEELTATMLTIIGDGYRKVEGAWAGFVPNDHPVVLPIKGENDELRGALALNHPAPDALGDATALATDEQPFDSAHFIANPVDSEYLADLDGFEFNRDIGGVDSFLMVAGGRESFFDPTVKDYVATLLHEMLHRYQGEAFTPDSVGQDVEGYDYSAENIELAALEERALQAALRATDPVERQEAARHFAAIRAARVTADDRVALDNSQERFEGSARYLEHTFAGDDTDYAYNSTNFEIELTVDPASAPGTKEWYGFGRWYSTGAAAFHLLHELGIDNIEPRIEAGEAPAEILADALDVAGNEQELVAAARAIYDPQEQLGEAAETAAEAAETEGPIFDDDGSV